MSGEQKEPFSKANGSKEASEAERFLVFSLCGEEYAVPLLKVKEVIALTEITSVPYTPPHFKGIMNLRGQVISIFDLRLKFRFSKSDMTQESSIIILDLSPLSLGVIVDSINCVIAVEPEDMRPPPDLDSQISNEYITGVTRKDKKLVLLLDIERTLGVEDIKTAKQQHSKKTA